MPSRPSALALGSAFLFAIGSSAVAAESVPDILNAVGKITAFAQRREAWDLVWKRAPAPEKP
jgi:hypothetical protein